MYCRFALLGIFMFSSALSEAANDAREPIVLVPRAAKLSPGLMTFVSSTMPGPYVGGWMDKSRYVDYELKVEPGKYRLVVKLVPQGGGYLSAKVDEGQALRRQVVRSRQPIYTPIEIKYGEIDIPKVGAHLRFTGDNINPPGLCLFFQAELTWVGPSSASARVKSPLEQAAEKERAAKAATAAKSADALADRLKGTTWSFYVMSGEFTGQFVPMIFGLDGSLNFFGSNKNFKAIDGQTIDIFYGAPGAFSRLRFADDLGSFKADPEQGIRQPRSGRLQDALGTRSSGAAAAPGTTAR
jgi:hypothetical protein